MKKNCFGLISASMVALLSSSSSSGVCSAYTPAVYSFMSRWMRAKVGDNTNRSPYSSSRASTTTPSSSSPAIVEPFQKPEPRIVRDDLPVVYVYDHCPFCVRVRFAMGVKNIKHTVSFMANDDVKTPTNLVGKKIAPIFALPEDDLVMAESMDIIALLDSDERFGPTGVLLPATGRTDIKEWQKSVQSLLRTLQRPRYVATGLLPEFQQLESRHAFIRNHQLPPYEKSEWKEKVDMDDKLRLYAKAMAKDPATLIEELNKKLVELNDIVYCDQYCSPGGLSLDDVDLWARLRSITIIRDVQWPEKLRSYMDNLAELADIPLYDEMAQ